MIRNNYIAPRFALAVMAIGVIILFAFQPAFSQAGVGSVITAEPAFTAGTLNSVTFDPSAIPGADAYEVCYFDSADLDIIICVALNRSGQDVLTGDLEDLIEGRIYGCFIRAHFELSGETIYSDTVYSTWEALSHDKLQTNNAPYALTIVEGAYAQSFTRAHNYPNPFNPKEEETTIVFESDGIRSLTILIYDLFGQLVYEETDVDVGLLRWNGRNGRGELVASGGYICLLKVGDKTISKHKLAVIK